MKKIISLIIALAMLVMTVPVAYAAETEEYREVLSIVKERLDIQDVYDKFESNTSNYNGLTTYYFNWSTEGEDSVYMSVGCTADGVITEFHYNDNSKTYSSERAFKKYETEQYRAAALNFIALLNPDIKDNIVISNADRYSMWSRNTSFSLEFVHDGIRVDNIQGSISIDSDDMTLQSFSLYDYADVTYPDKATFMDKAAAVEAYKNVYGLELVYILTYEDEKYTATPYYVPVSNGNEYINAVTGEEYVYDYSVQYAKTTMEAAADLASGGSMANRFSKIEQQEIDNVEGLYSIDKIVKMLKDNASLDIPDNAVADYYNLSKNSSTNDYIYDINLTCDDESRYVNINAKTGEIKNYRRYFKSETDESLEEEKLKAAALKYAKSLAGNKLEYYSKEDFEGNTLTLHRIKNGARVEGDTIRVTVNKNNGKLTYYNISYTEAEFPSVDGVISAEAATKAFFDNVSYEIKYLFVPVLNERPKEAVAVYSFDYSESHRLNPFTGEIEKNDTEEVTLEYNDINGHYAESYITKLAQYNIGFKAESFKPDSSITQKDLITLLTQAFGSVSTYREADYKYIFDRAQSLNIVSKEERDDDAAVTRLQAAVFLIRALGAERYAGLNGIWSCPFSDVTEKTGYVCILSGMGIIKGDGTGSFNPDEHITNADSAIMIFNALSR